MGKIHPFTHLPQGNKETGPGSRKAHKNSVRQTAAGAAVNTILVLKQVDTSLYIRARNTTLPPRKTTPACARSFWKTRVPVPGKSFK